MTLDDVRAAPGERGRVELIARRPRVDEREELEEAQLDPELGLVGDNWSTKRSSRGEPPNPLAQVMLMSSRAAALVAGERERWALAGDQLYVDLDLSYRNLPPGTRLSIGEATIEVTDEPHHGCGKFAARFGVDALKLVNSAEGRELNLRGVCARVVEGGTVRRGDAVVRAAVSAAPAG